MKRFGMAAVMMVALAAGCDDGAPAGSVLKLHVGKGSATSALALEGVLVWSNTAGSPDVSGTTARTTLAGTLPASLSLALTDPPPDNLLNDYTRGGLRPHEAKIGIAAIGVVPKGYAYASGDEPPGTYAVAQTYLVAWVDRDLEPNTFSAAMVGGALKRGYHLLKGIPAETYAAAHPENASCETFTADCAIPKDDNDRGAWTAYYACSDAAAQKAGCLAPAPGFDRLAPASGEFGTLIELELTTDPNAQTPPNWT